MKRMILAFVLVTFSSCVCHAQNNKNEHSKKVEKKSKKDSDVQVIDFSHDSGHGDSGDKGNDSPFPDVVSKGKL